MGETKQISTSEPLHEEMIKINYIIDEIEVYMVYYDGFGGASQGGGLALATAALDFRQKFVISEIPYLCHISMKFIFINIIKNLIKFKIK